MKSLKYILWGSLLLFAIVSLTSCTSTTPPPAYPDCNLYAKDTLLTDKSRGHAFCTAGFIKTPVDGMVCSTSGCKSELRVKNHECEHLVRQKNMGCTKWFYKYLTNKEFKAQEELIAKEAEWK